MLNIIGHENVKQKLKKIITSNSVSHAYLFSGKDGIGKKTLATEFAKSVMCDTSTEFEYCGKCEVCLTFENENDFKIIEPTKNVIKVDEIRNFCSELFLKPTRAAHKFFIIDNADCMNEQAQNALLKVLEEPPLYATIILVVSNKEKLLNTIKSRVVEIQFDSLSDTEIENILKSHNIEYTEDAIKYANGSYKKALDFINDDLFDIAKDVAKALESKDFLIVNRKFEEIKTDKKIKPNIESILEKVMQIFFIKFKAEKNYEYRTIEKLEETIQKIKRNGNVDLALDSLMVELCKI